MFHSISKQGLAAHPVGPYLYFVHTILEVPNAH